MASSNQQQGVGGGNNGANGDGSSAARESADSLTRLDGQTLTLFYGLLRSLQNSTASGNASVFQLKPVFSQNYLFFSFLYGLLGIGGLLLNVYFIWRNIRLRVYRSSLYYFLIHIAITHALASALILPTSLAILLSRYWIFGDFMCYTLTMVQDLPSRVVLLLFVLIAIDRYRQFAYNSLDALPRHGCVVGVWLISSCLAFPACVFVEFYDMYSYIRLDMLRGIGLCVVNNHSMEEYARAMFVVVYVVPLAVFAFAFTRISVELPKQDQPVILAHLTMHSGNGGFSSMMAEDWPLAPGLDSGSVNADVERRIQRYLTACGVGVALSSLPLNVMSVIQFGLTEDYADKSAMYDVTYAIFVWISFLPTVCTPVVCLAMMSVAGCPTFYRLMKRWREGNVSDYVRRFSDLASTSASSMMRLYPRTSATGGGLQSHHRLTMPDSADTTMTSLSSRRSQSVLSSRSTAALSSSLAVSNSTSTMGMTGEKRTTMIIPHQSSLEAESTALMQMRSEDGTSSDDRSASVVPRRSSVAANNTEANQRTRRRASLSTSVSSPIVP